MKNTMKKAIEEYQCTGCVRGSNITCFNGDVHGEGCGSHVAGTSATGIGKFFLGLPKPFMRLGHFDDMTPKIFETFTDDQYNKWNIPTWKHKDKNGNTLVRGLMPRRNEPFIHIFLEDCLDKIDCYELTEEDIEFMD